jgi:hypothetical protein
MHPCTCGIAPLQVVDSKQPVIKLPTLQNFTATQLTGSITGRTLEVGVDFVISASDLGRNGIDDGVLDVTCTNTDKGISFINKAGTTFFAPTGTYALTCTATDGRTAPVTADVMVSRLTGVVEGSLSAEPFTLWPYSASHS